jgi:hypothetical protein
MVALAGMTLVWVGVIGVIVSIPGLFASRALMRWGLALAQKKVDHARPAVEAALARGDDLDAVAGVALDLGVGPVPAMRLVRDAAGVSPSVAKEAVLRRLPANKLKSLARLGPRLDALIEG